jgi:hypothetical protein
MPCFYGDICDATHCSQDPVGLQLWKLVFPGLDLSLVHSQGPLLLDSLSQTEKCATVPQLPKLRLSVAPSRCSLGSPARLRGTT